MDLLALLFTTPALQLVGLLTLLCGAYIYHR